MLTHLAPAPRPPGRTVVIGAGGFIGRHLARRLTEGGMAVLALGRGTADLAAPDAAATLTRLIEPEDTVVFLSAITPDRGRDIATAMVNLAIGRAVCAALAAKRPRHCVYVSSDAVYPLDGTLTSEASPAAPTDLYGAMHRMRELMVESLGLPAVALLRPTMVYGADDSHNSYGPNRFRRQAAKEGRIVLGGGGEETRDHIAVDDAAALIELCIRHHSTGILNLATGRSISFRDLARLVADQFLHPVTIETTPRTLPVTHRSFDITARLAAFPDWSPTPLDEGIHQAHQEAEEAR